MVKKFLKQFCLLITKAILIGLVFGLILSPCCIYFGLTNVLYDYNSKEEIHKCINIEEVRKNLPYNLRLTYEGTNGDYLVYKIEGGTKTSSVKFMEKTLYGSKSIIANILRYLIPTFIYIFFSVLLVKTVKELK